MRGRVHGLGQMEGDRCIVSMFRRMRSVEQGNTTPVSPKEIGIIETDSYSDKYSTQTTTR